MTVRVDKAEWEWRGKKWCHLVADTLDELHTFAARVGMKRAWFQVSKAGFPHYDLTEARRTKALQLGAVDSTRAEIMDAAKKLRAEYNAGNS